MTDIEKAIKTMEYNRHILGLPDQGNKWHENANTKACDMAIQALQEKAQRDKGCEHCRMLEKYRTTSSCGVIYGCDDCNKNCPNNWGTDDCIGETYEEVPINCCPHCGRKLGE